MGHFINAMLCNLMVKQCLVKTRSVGKCLEQLTEILERYRSWLL